MRGTEKWSTEAAVVTGLVILLSASGVGSTVAWAVTAGTSAYNANGLPSVLDGSVLDGSVSGDSGTGMDHAAQELGIQDEMEGLQQFLSEVMGQQDEIQGSFSFWELVKELVRRSLREILEQAGTGAQNTLFSKVRKGEHMLFQVAAIGIIGAVLSNVSSVFKGGQIPDTGFFITYILLFTCLAASSATSLQVAAQVLDQILEFVKLMTPAYFMSVAFSGGSMNALVLHGGILGAVTLVQWICSAILLSTVKVYMLTILGSYVVKEALLTELTELLEQAVGWGLKTLTNLVVGFHPIRSIILPHTGAAGQAGMKRLLKIISGLGQGAGTVAQVVLGSDILIKNTMRAAAVVVLAVITVIPIIKLMMLMVLYQYVAAIVQPVCDKRVVSCVSGVSRGRKLLIQIVLYSMLLFMIFITITCVPTNVNCFTSQSLSEQSAGQFLKLFKWRSVQSLPTAE